MRKILLTSAALLLASPASAQVGFITGMMIGSAMSGSDTVYRPQRNSPDVLFRAQLDRKIEWWDVYTNRTCDPRVAVGSLWDAFAAMAKSPNDWDVLEIRRVPFTDGVYCLWFVFTPKEKKQ